MTPAPHPVLLAAGLLAASLLGGGCALKQASPSKQTFLVEAHRVAPARITARFGPLRVRPIQVAAAFEGRGFVYRRGDWHYESDFYHEFLVPPRALLTDQVRQWFVSSGLCAAVLEPSSKADAAFSLDGTVTEFYGDFRDKAQPKAALAIRFVLTDETPAGARMLFQRAYRQEVTLARGGADALVAGWSTALDRILADCERDLAEAGPTRANGSGHQ